MRRRARSLVWSGRTRLRVSARKTPSRSRNSSPATLGRATRQAHGEHGTFARLTRHRDVAAHHLAELSADHEPKARAAVLARRLRGRLRELLYSRDVGSMIRAASARTMQIAKLQNS